MSMDDSRKEYLKQYRKDNLKRVPLELRVDIYNKFKSVADKQGKTVNGYLKELVEKEIEAKYVAPAPAIKPVQLKPKTIKDPKGGGYIIGFVPEEEI